MIFPTKNGNITAVGGFNQSEKYARQIGEIFPNFRGENKKMFETTTQLWYAVNVDEP